MLVADLIRWCYQCDLVPYRPERKEIRWLNLKDDVFFLVLSAVLLLLPGHTGFSCSCTCACSAPLSYAWARSFILWKYLADAIHKALSIHVSGTGTVRWCVSGSAEGADWKEAYIHVSDIISGLICTRGSKTPRRNNLLDEFVHQRLTII